MASRNGSFARRNSQPSADPLHIAKRKRLIAEEFARDGSHSAIRKTISWGDVGGKTDSPKRARTSLSTSITPGLSDMSTPTPINRLRPALKSSSQRVNVPSQNSSQSKREFDKPASIRPGSTSRAPIRDSTPQKPQSQPVVINLISDETPQSDQSPKPRSHGNQVAGPSSYPSRTGAASSQQVTGPPPASPTFDAGTQYQEQDTFDSDRPATSSHMPSPRPNTDVAASQKRTTNDPGPRATGKHLLAPPTSPSRRKHRTSEIGIQTIPDKELDWLGDLDLDDSMSAIKVSRIWAERRSGSKGGEPHGWQPEPEPDEPLTGNFLDEFEGRPVDNEERAPESLDGRPVRVLEARDRSDDQDVASQAAPHEDILGHAPASSRPSSPPVDSAPAQPSKPSANAVSYPHSYSSPLRYPSSPPHNNIFHHSQPSVRPYPFNLQERKSTGTPSRLERNQDTTEPDIQPRPVSSSQPNPFVAAARERSRLYTPQPAPPTRTKNLDELRAAPTLGRSMLENTLPMESTKNAVPPSSRAESCTPSKGSESQAKSLKAAPTLGRSTDWGHAGPSRAVASNSNETNQPSGHQPTDYDAEYGPAPEIPSDFPSRPPSSPAHHTWEIESAHASTPHRLVTKIPAIAQAVTREEKTVKGNPVAQPPTLAALEKRRRSSVAPLAESKKIRREYDTIESNAVPNVRAHKDTYDESGQRSWVPKRPNMKRALDAPPTVKSKLPTTVAEEPEPAEQVPPESAIESRAETFDPASYSEPMQEHQVELDEQTGYETGSKVPRTSTEIAETPQSTRIRNLYDLATSELQSHRFTSEPPERIDSQPVPVSPPYRPDAMREDEPAAVNATQEVEPVFTPAVKLAAPNSRIKSSRYTRSEEKPTRKKPYRPKRPSSGLHITPARSSVSSPPRTRLSMGGRSGISVLQVSKSDQEILVQAGLRPVLKRLSQAHGFTVEVVAEVYQETGSLKETEDTLEKMKHSAERMRVSISRRKSTLEVLRGEERDHSERDSSEASGNNDYLSWDTSRMSSRILFGEGV